MFFVHVAYLYLLTMGGVVAMVDVIARRQRTFQIQSVALGVCALIPLAANVGFVAEVVSVDPTPPAFLVSGALFYWMVAHADVTAISPVARQTVVDTMGAGMFVVSDDRLVDVNRQGREILGADPDADVVGRSLDDLFGDPGIVSRFDGVVQGTDTVTIDTGEGRRHFEVEVSPVNASVGCSSCRTSRSASNASGSSNARTSNWRGSRAS